MNDRGMLDEIMPMIMLILLFFGIGIFYNFYSEVINKIVIGFSVAVLTPFSFIFSGAERGISIISKADPVKMVWHDASMALDFAGSYFRWIAGAVIGYIGLKGMGYGSVNNWRRRLVFKALLENNVSDFPSIAPAVKLDFLAMNQYKGPWRVVDTHIKLADDNNLLYRKVGDKTTDVKLDAVFTNGWTVMSRLKRRYTNKGVHLNKKETTKVFEDQLGELMPEDIMELPSHIRALAASFMLFINSERTAAYTLLGQLSASYESDDDYREDIDEVDSYYIDMTGVDEILANPKYTNVDSILMEYHADYIYTWLIALLETAKDITKGELAPSRYLWVRPVDRTLWYAMNQQGGRMPHAEAAGIWAHMEAEKKLEKSLSSPPEVVRAVESMEYELKKELWLPEEKAKMP